VANHAASRLWSPTNADERCTKYIPGVQEFCKVGIQRGAVVCVENTCEARECPVIVAIRSANGPSTVCEMMSESNLYVTFADVDDISLAKCSATLGTNGLNSADVPLSNKQTLQLSCSNQWPFDVKC